MKLVGTLPNARVQRRRAAAPARGFTIIEVMVSFGILALGMVGVFSAFLLLNRYAANQRNLSVARALCQERIEQALTLPFRPTGTTATVPAAPNSDPTTNGADPYKTLTILGPATSYNSTTGTLNSASTQQTSLVNGQPESIPVYTQPDGTSAKSSANVIFTRTTSVSQASLFYATTGVTSTISLNVVQFNVDVSFVAYGKTYTTSMSTLRGPD